MKRFYVLDRGQQFTYNGRYFVRDRKKAWTENDVGTFESRRYARILVKTLNDMEAQATTHNKASTLCKDCRWYISPPYKMARICSACNANLRYSNRFEQRT